VYFAGTVEYLDDPRWREFMSKNSRSTATTSAVDKRLRIQSWLMQEGWKIAEGHHPNATWVISASVDKGFTLIIAQPANATDRIDIQAGVGIDGDHQKLVAAMDAKQRRNLFWELRFDLLKLAVDFNGFDEPVRQINVMQRMYDDGLTKDRFLQRVSKIKNSQVLIVWTLRRAFDQPPDEDVLGSGFVQ
jgi:hypothetical protein